MKKNNNKEKGITLIALIITIIIMLILVSVTINMAVNGGLFSYAKRAAEETNKAIEKENAFLNLEDNLTTEQLEFKMETYGYTVTVYGDMNGDGLVKSNDATKVAQYVARNTTLDAQQMVNADVNLDGVVDQEDADLIAQVAAGNNITLPQPKT